MKKIIIVLFVLMCTFLLYINFNKNVTHLKNENSKANVGGNVSVKYTKSNNNSGSTIYSIKGKSDNITGKDLTLMNESREGNRDMAVKYPDKVFINGNTMKKQVALTFDDGIDPVITPDILKILKENNVKASFFVIGSTVIKNSSIVKKAYNDGNLILNHSYSHIELTKAKDQVIKDEIVKTDDAKYYYNCDLK